MAHETSIRLPGRLVGIVRESPPPSSASLPAAAALAPAASVPAASRENVESAAERERWQRLLTNLEHAAAALHAQHQQVVEGVEQLAVELAVAVAGRFLQTKVEVGDFPFAALIRQAVERLETRQPVVVTLHPDDLRLLCQRFGAEAGLVDHPEIRLTEDPSLPRGAFHLQAQERGLQFDLESRLAALRQQLMETVVSGGHAPLPPPRQARHVRQAT
jgi:flagellar biosynthesis/type III secretory pathway protein FliH